VALLFEALVRLELLEALYLPYPVVVSLTQRSKVTHAYS
jgi:hypothetical protein